ncbi:MAG: hypothetical protein WCC95_21515 [Candidatus Sulfotelmatobacter sp.]|jgi:hypothetical protein
MKYPRGIPAAGCGRLLKMRLTTCQLNFKFTVECAERAVRGCHGEQEFSKAEQCRMVARKNFHRTEIFIDNFCCPLIQTPNAERVKCLRYNCNTGGAGRLRGERMEFKKKARRRGVRHEPTGRAELILPYWLTCCII